MNKIKQRKQVVLISKLLRSNFRSTKITSQMNEKSFKRRLTKIRQKQWQKQSDREGKKRDARRNFFERFLVSHVKREEIFLNFPSHMKKSQEKMNFHLLKSAKSVIFCTKKRDSLFIFHCEKWFKKISLLSWGKGNLFGGFPFLHVGREEIIFSFPFSTTTLNRRKKTIKKVKQIKFRKNIIEMTSKNEIWKFAK